MWKIQPRGDDRKAMAIFNALIARSRFMGALHCRVTLQCCRPTLGREMGLSDRTIDAIQGHAGKTAGDGYGDVTIIAKEKVIEVLPDYNLHE